MNQFNKQYRKLIIIISAIISVITLLFSAILLISIFIIKNNALTVSLITAFILTLIVMTFSTIVSLNNTKKEMMNDLHSLDKNIDNTFVKRQLTEKEYFFNEVKKIDENFNKVINDFFVSPHHYKQNINILKDIYLGRVMVDKASFNKAMFALIKNNPMTLSAYVLFETNATNVKLEEKLLDQITLEFDDCLILKYDGKHVCIFIPKFNATTLLEERIKRFYTNTVIKNVDMTRSEVEVLSFRVAAVIHPSVDRQRLEEEAFYAIKHTDSYIVRTPKVTLNELFYNDNIRETTQKILINSHHFIEAISELSTSDDYQQVLKTILEPLAKQFDFENAGLIIKKKNEEFFKVEFESQLFDKPSFKKISPLQAKVGQSLFNLINKDNGLGANISLDLPSSLAHVCQTLELKSFYFFPVQDKDNHIGFFYFTSSRLNENITSERPLLLEYVLNILSAKFNSINVSKENHLKTILLNNVINEETQYLYIYDNSSRVILYATNNLSKKFGKNSIVGLIEHETIFGATSDFDILKIYKQKRSLIIEELSHFPLKIKLIELPDKNQTCVLLESISSKTPSNSPLLFDKGKELSTFFKLQQDVKNLTINDDHGFIVTISINEDIDNKKIEEQIALLKTLLENEGYSSIIYTVDKSTIALLLSKVSRTILFTNVSHLYNAINDPVYKVSVKLAFALFEVPVDIISNKITKEIVFDAVNASKNQKDGTIYVVNAKNALFIDNEEHLNNSYTKFIKDKAFEAYISPLIGGQKNHVFGAKFNISLFDKYKGGYVSVNEFLSIYEKDRKIVELDKIMLNKVGDFVAKEGAIILRNNLLETIQVSISLESILSSDYNQHLKQFLSKQKFLPYFLTICIPIEILVKNSSAVASFIRSMKEFKVSFLLENYTYTMYDLDHIANIGFTSVSLKKTIISDIEGDINQFYTLSNIINNCNSQNLRVIVRGVSNDKQLTLISRLGIYLASGPLFGPLLDKDSFASKVLY